MSAAPANPAQGVSELGERAKALRGDLEAHNFDDAIALLDEYAIALTAAIGAGSPAQVTNAMVEAGYAAIFRHENDDDRNPPVLSRGDIHIILTAAIGAGGQAVAWRISCPDDEIYGRGPDTVRFHPLSPDEIASGYTQQPLSALSQPHPADERVVEAASAVLKWLDGGCSSWGVPEQQIRILALAAKEGR